MTDVPEAYFLSYSVFTERCTFDAVERLVFYTDSAIPSLELDCLGLEIISCEVVIGKEKKSAKFIQDDKAEKLTITFPQTLPKGINQIILKFRGVLTDNLAGFYRSRYTHEGQEKYMATTQFEAAEAKRAFPCFDNPSMKAVFHVTFTIDQKLSGISNMLPKSEKIIPGGKKRIEFFPTPKMSTYLLYLGVGQFEMIEDNHRQVLVRVITPPGKSQHGKFALEVAKKCLDFFEDYFKYPYPLPKLDLIAVPDFAAGAMENWGAITFRENSLLYYAGKSSIQTKKRIAEVVAHEIAHMWFGNLVTMKWWDDLWLNESFATFMAYKAVDHFFPEWHIWEEYITDTVFGGMALDSLKSSHPIQVKINTTEEIDEIFDEISYDKGGSILRMLYGYLGGDLFREGLRYYIKKFAYGNTKGNDLWESLEKVSKVPVTNLMSKFIRQIGFPMVTVKKKEKSIVLSQSRFLFESAKKDEIQLWDIPLVTADATDRVERVMMTDKDQTVDLESVDDWSYVNKNYDGFFITDYDDVSLAKFGENIKSLNTSDRLGLLHDLFALVLSGKKDVDLVLNYILTYFSKLTDPTMVTYIIHKVLGLYLLVENSNAKKLVLEFSKQVIVRIGYEPQKNEDPRITALRNSALFALSFFDEKKTINFFNKKFIDYLAKDSSLHADLHGLTFSAIAWANKKNYTKILELYEKNEVQEEKNRLLMALANVKDELLVRKTLEYSLTPRVRFSNLLYVVFAAARNPYGKKASFDWLIKNWGELQKRTGGHANTLLRRIVKSIIPECVGFEKEAEAFLKNNKVKGLERSYEQANEELRINSRFVKSCAAKTS